MTTDSAAKTDSILPAACADESDLLDKLSSLSTAEKPEKDASTDEKNDDTTKSTEDSQLSEKSDDAKDIIDATNTKENEKTAEVTKEDKVVAEATETQNKNIEQTSPEEAKKKFSGLIESVQSVNVVVQLADQQADVNSPLFSVKSFEELGLAADLLKGIYAMKFTKPSKVQEKALPLLLTEKPQNMIAQSQSGTGKTAAFVLTMLSRVDAACPYPQALCLAPSRELAKQIYDVAVEMGQFTSITIAEAVKESTPRKDLHTENIIIGTPGTILELQRRRLLSFERLRVLVFDEADVMLDKQGMGVQSLRVRKMCPPSTQILLFSATFNEAVEDFAAKVAERANRISLKREELSVEAIKQYFMKCASVAQKLEVLGHIYGLLTIGSSIIFVNSRDAAEKVQQHMQRDGFTTEYLHGKLSPEDRDAVLERFRSGHTKVLITTNVLARGIDISQISLVVNFDMPVNADHTPDPETYLHRIGRTGRFGRHGTAINLVHDAASMRVLRFIETYLKRPIAELPCDDLEVLEEMLQSKK